MGIDDGDDWSMTKMLGDEFITRPSSGFNGERVNNNPSGVAFDEGDVGNVVATNLPDTFGDFEESVIDIEFGVAPQVGVNGVGGVAFQEGIPTNVAGLPALRIGDAGVFKRCDEAALSACEVFGVEGSGSRTVESTGVLRCWLRCVIGRFH